MALSGVAAFEVSDDLHDPHRTAAARRLLAEAAGPAAFDRLSGLAARLIGAGHAKVTIFTDQDLVIGGWGLPPGVVGGPALLTGALSAVVVSQAIPLNVPHADEEERVAALPAVTSGQVRAYLGVPLIAASGHAVGALAVYDSVPREWSDDEAALLEQLADSVIAELELSAARSAVGTSLTRLEVALEASAVGIWERDLRTGTIYWDERSAALFGIEGAVEKASFEQMLADHIHPGDHPAVRSAMDDAVAERGHYVAEARAVHRDGGIRWTVSQGRVITDASGEPIRMLGTILDVTEARRQAAQRLSAVQRAAALAEAAAELANATRLDQLAGVTLRAAQVLGASSSALAVLDTDGVLRMHLSSGLVDAVRSVAADIELSEHGIEVPLDDAGPAQYVARRGARLIFPDRASLVERFPASADAVSLLDVEALAALPLRLEGRLVGSFVAVWNTGHEFTADDVEVLEALTAQIGLSALRLQAAAERTAAVAAMAEANQRLQLLAEAGRLLSNTLDSAVQLEQLAALVVPALGDWCWIVATDDHGQLQEIASAHRDPTRQADVETYVAMMVHTITDQSAPRVVHRTGRPLIIPELGAERIALSLTDPAAREALLALAPASVAAVPLATRGETLGVLCLLNGTDRGPHTSDEIETALEIGRRAGVALHQARLYGQQRDLAVALQRSMLTEPPVTEEIEIAVRYVPAAEGAEIGGDWYDAFVQRGGATVLVIGDVVGHDTGAAAAMGQVRGLLRAISYSSGGRPAETLTELDRALEGLALDTMATALVARLERDDIAAAGGRRRLCWASAGHPAPVVIAPDGTIAVLDGDPADLLLGVLPTSHREDRLALLEPGSTVLLYTDGLVERRDRDIDTGTEALLRVLAHCVTLPLEELCDRVLQEMFLPDAEDDVAVLAFRLRAGD